MASHQYRSFLAAASRIALFLVLFTYSSTTAIAQTASSKVDGLGRVTNFTIDLKYSKTAMYSYEKEVFFSQHPDRTILAIHIGDDGTGRMVVSHPDEILVMNIRSCIQEKDWLAFELTSEDGRFEYSARIRRKEHNLSTVYLNLVSSMAIVYYD